MFFLFEHIDPLVFLISLFVGLAYTYFTSSQPQVVMKYPTPFNIKDTVYQDKNGVCYRYKIREVACPKDQNKVTNIFDGS